MKTTDRRQFDMFRRVRDFGGTYGSLFPESSVAAPAFAAVTAAIGEIGQHDLAETTAVASARPQLKADARRALARCLLKVAKTARVVAGDDAELSVHFDSHNWVTDQGLVTAARQAIAQATPVKAQFEAHGLPPTFLTELEEALDRFVVAVDRQGTHRGQVVAERAAIKAAAANALKAIRQLDVIVPNRLGADPVALEVWRAARQIKHRSSPHRGEDAAPAAASDARATATATPAATPAPVVARTHRR
jgi:hypothetical protein